MKRLLLSVITIGLVSVGAFAATRAYFTSEVSILGNSIETGTIHITAEGTTTASIVIPSMKPGDFERKWVNLLNDGTLPIDYLTVSKDKVNDPDNLLSQIIISTTCKIPGVTEAAYFTNDWGIKPTVANWFDNSDILDMSFYRTSAKTLPVNSKYQCTLDFIMPTTVGNEFQGKSASFDLIFTAEQVH